MGENNLRYPLVPLSNRFEGFWTLNPTVFDSWNLVKFVHQEYLSTLNRVS